MVMQVLGGNEQDPAVTTTDDGGEKCGPMRDIPWTRCVRPGDDVHGSVELPVGTEIHVNAADSAPLPPT